MIEQHRQSRKPRARRETSYAAHQRQRRDRHNHDIRRRAHGCEQVKISRRQRNGPHPRGHGEGAGIDDERSRGMQQRRPAGRQCLRQQRVFFKNPGPKQVPQERQQHGDAEDDQK